jgi:heptosyltransferase II
MDKILVIQQKMIGDVLVSSLICAHLKNRYPEAKIHYAVHEHTKAVVENHPSIDRLILKPKDQSIVAFAAYLNTLRRERYDLVVDAYGKLESNLMVLFSGSKHRVSYHKWYTQWIYSKTVKRSSVVYSIAGNAIEDRLRLIFEEQEIQEQTLTPQIHVTERDQKWAQDYLADQDLDRNKPLVMVSVLGSAENKSLPAQQMAQILDHIAQHTQATLLLNYIPNQRPLVDAILAHTQAVTQSRIKPEIYGNNLNQFLALLAECSVLIGNEGGAVNMAKALGRPTFTIFSPWINKRAWNAFVDDQNHCAVHLKDFRPELYASGAGLQAKKNHQSLYQALELELFSAELSKFYKTHLY